MICGLVFRLFDHRSAFIKTAVGAYPVRHLRLRASWALDHIDRGHSFVGSSFVPPCSRDPLFRYRHVKSFSVSLRKSLLSIVSPVLLNKSLRRLSGNRCDDLMRQVMPCGPHYDICVKSAASASQAADHFVTFSLSRAKASHLGSAKSSSEQVHVPFKAPHSGHNPGHSPVHSGFMGISRTSS
jgi:hypothetical protein